MIVTYEQLKDYVGGKNPADVVVRLERLGIKYLVGKQHRPFTTEVALNAAMGLTSPDSEQQDYRPLVEVG